MVKLTPSRVLDACAAAASCRCSFLVLGTVPSKEASLLVQVVVPRTCHSAADHRGGGVMVTNAACLPLFPGDSFHASLTCLGQPRKTLQASSRLNFCDFFFSDFVYFWLCWVFVAARMLCGEHRYFLVAVCGFLIAVASLIAEHGL